jgi:hypothetical protein
MKGLLSVLACSSAVCGTFHKKDISILQQLLEGEITANIKHQLHQSIPTLFDLLSPFEKTPNYLMPIVTEIIRNVQQTFSIPINITNLSQGGESSLSFFPNLPKIRSRGTYSMDKVKVKGETLCTKKTGRHASLLPGIFTVFCPHGTYFLISEILVFQIMSRSIDMLILCSIIDL